MDYSEVIKTNCIPISVLMNQSISEIDSDFTISEK